MPPPLQRRLPFLPRRARKNKTLLSPPRFLPKNCGNAHPFLRATDTCNTCGAFHTDNEKAEDNLRVEEKKTKDDAERKKVDYEQEQKKQKIADERAREEKLVAKGKW